MSTRYDGEVTSDDAEFLLRKMVWHDDEHLTVGDTKFLVTGDTDTWKTAETDSERFFLMKDRWDVQAVSKYLPEPVPKMIEFGIFKGGSIALYEQLYSPERLVGVDVDTERVKPLDRWLEKRQATDRVRLYYGTDQEDKEKLRAIAHDNFSDRSLDAVIDDASHHYEPSKTSLNVFLPYLRPGGIYLIEDWAWAHWQGDRDFQEAFGSILHENEKTPMTSLVFDAVMFSASRPDIISAVSIDPSRVVLTRGPGVIDDESFDIATGYRTGRWNIKFSTRLRPLALDLWRRGLPYQFRRRVPRSFARWAHKYIPH